MTVVLWIINILLACVFGIAGLSKLTRPMSSLIQMGMKWVEETSPAMVRSIGTVELLGVAGLILPKATGVAPGLTPLAAIGLATVMLGAVVVHLQRAESVRMPMVLGGMAVVSAGIGFALL
ncbi:MAG: DoxX family protein [Marmoricola sp.]